MRLVLLVNTSASSVTPRVRVVVHKTLSVGHEVLLRETNRRWHAARLAQGAAADGADVVVVLGGDGTLNEAANGLAGTSTALAVVPGGSTNVFARAIGMADDPVEAAGQLLACLEGAPDKVGLGRANARYFLFHAGIGFDAAVVAKVERVPRLKRYAGPVVFLAASLGTWAGGYRRNRPVFSVAPEGLGPSEASFAVCLNTSPYTFLGRRRVELVPGTALGDGLSLMAMDELGPGAMLPTVAAALGRGVDTTTSAHVRVARRLHRLDITCTHPVPYQLDGDYVGEADRIALEWAPDALTLIRPRSG
jgi:diacylglycerol kinase family enzyme